ncbi:hypothetical protein SK803_01625 [Lentzea sp. BCCO 10_0856]|uniref:SseB protein N-terminal domain-containing protein n=1 Tax=Lentzea miocenica TaxID=3095431 RepID=A0ABU4SSR6_9PSEU|nr:hypothetical protein [Lentzea sp. BCCO 10_0856]MDX8028885.1 hypothetical protein [Lentzea sp. BCCO 10_0856]
MGIPFNQAMVRRALEHHVGMLDRDPEPLPYNAVAAQEVAGGYDNDAMVMTIDDTGSGLVLEVLIRPEIRKSAEMELPADHAPFPMGLLPRDEYVITEGAFTGQRGFFTRDASGYHRYSAQDAIDLVKIRTLAEAGVPLARERVVRLRAGNALFLSAEAAALLDRLREIGVSERGVRMEREVWVLMQAVAPDEAAVWLADKTESLADPEFQQIYLGYDEAFDWSPDDPRLPAPATRAAAWMSSRPEMPLVDPEITSLAMSAAGASSPAWNRMAGL